MIAAKVACPHCGTVLGISSPLAPGQGVQCPKCGKAFALSGPAGKPENVKSARPAPAAPKKRAPAPVRQAPAQEAEEGLDFAEVGAAPLRRRSKSNKGVMVVIGLISVGLILLGVGLFVDWSSFAPKGNSDNSKKGEEKQQAKGTGADEGGEEGPEEGGKQGPEPPVPPKKNFLAQLPPEMQKKVDAAVERGVRFLKQSQGPDGRWTFNGPQPDVNVELNARNQVGLACLGGLTLLECRLPGQDPAVQKVATFVRKSIPTLNQTYDISLAILFLDRLGESADKDLIRALAMRLVAGQTDNGGWTYACPVLGKKDQDQLAAVLRSLPEPGQIDLVKTPKKPDPYNKLALDDPSGEKPSTSKLMLDTPPPGQGQLEAIGKLSGTLQAIPVLKVKPPETPQPQKSDNSNTQFAALALWTARKYDLPLDRTIGLTAKRFRTSQLYTGAWSYGYVYTVGLPFADQKKRHWDGKDTMTCAGLIGLAMGHGLALELKHPITEDPAVQRGLKALGRALIVVKSLYNNPKAKKYNMYFLWSVERVGVIYELAKIGGEEWYGWGADFLVNHQNQDGSWYGKIPHGSNPTVDTCMALLFLKRANLAQGLKTKLALDQ